MFRFLPPLGSFVGLDHEIPPFVGTVFLLPGHALVAEFIHLARTDRSVLLASGETDHPQGLEGEGGDSLLKRSEVLECEIIHGKRQTRSLECEANERSKKIIENNLLDGTFLSRILSPSPHVAKSTKEKQSTRKS